MRETRTLRASTLMAFISSVTGYTVFSHGRSTAEAFQGHPSRRCAGNVSPLSSHRWRSTPVRLCAVAVDHGTHGHEQGQGKLDGQDGAASNSGLSSTHPNGQPLLDEDEYTATVAAAAPRGATENAVAATRSATTSRARQKLTNGDAGVGARWGAKWYAIGGDQARPAATRSETEVETESGRGTAKTTPGSPERARWMNEQLPRWGESSKRGNPTIGSPGSSFDAIMTTKGSKAAAGTFTPSEVEEINGAPNSELVVGQTIEVELGAGVGETSEVRESDALPSLQGGSIHKNYAGVGEAEAGSGSGSWGKERLPVSKVSRISLERRWKKRVIFVLRTVQIWAFLVHVLVKLLRQKLVQRDEARMSARRRKLGRYLCKAFLKLGPTFIKIGQLLSTRVDLLSTEYIEELSQLQDNVPGFGGERAMKIIERELGAPVSELFDRFNSTPLAAASLGQVHEAWLDGQRYAVKVQRPGLEDLFRVDLNSIGALASVLDRFDPKLDGASRDWGAIFRESKRVLFEEVDYLREGKNAERFSENFKKVEWVKAPSINWSRSTNKVLCMEFLKGTKISDMDKIEKAGIDRSLLATRIAECYLAQLCRHGFFHCDPHPGNLACDAVGGGRIIFYDFGMMDELSDSLKRKFVDLMFGIYGNDVKEVVDALEEMEVIRKGADRLTVERIARFYLGEFQSTLTKGGKYINQLDPEEEKALVRRERAKIGQDLFSGTAAVPLQFPASFTFVFRAFTTLDGIGKTLDPGYDLTKIASPYLKQLLDLKDGSAFVSVLKTWQKRLGWRGQDVASVVQSPRRVKHVNDVVTQLETGDLRLRVRVLEAEAAFARIEAVQGSLTAAVLATLLLNAGVMLAGSATRPSVLGSRMLFAFAGFFGMQIPVGYFQVWRLKRQADNTKGFR